MASTADQPEQPPDTARPDNQHDKLTRDTLLDLEDHHLVNSDGHQSASAFAPNHRYE
ncbi:hypothetical protein AB0M97_27015 [Streptomyces sp. NPDC051207]|uniref:hypothetical protein n=1 Tax=Streptomyces sp. NPDC051207 TaxID=3154641 RepID=UPI003425930A